MPLFPSETLHLPRAFLTALRGPPDVQGSLLVPRSLPRVARGGAATPEQSEHNRQDGSVVPRGHPEQSWASL
jgi:hypothetical protein